jgi:hypothetical protein
MKRTARPPSQLSASLHHRLNQYTLAASVAGVGAIALAVPADAKIIYTPAHIVIGKGQTFKLDLNHDGIIDFELVNILGQEFVISGISSQSKIHNSISIASRNFRGSPIAAALRKGSTILGKSAYVVGALAFQTTSSGRYYGKWFPNVKNRYLGLTFYINGKNTTAGHGLMLGLLGTPLGLPAF